MDMDMETTMTDTDDQSIVDPVVRVKPKRPSLYQVILLNDDFTPMDFVVQLLNDLFLHTYEESMAIMLEIHHLGRGIAGIYTREIAVEQSEEAMKIAKANKYPLITTVEVAPDDGDSDSNS